MNKEQHKFVANNLCRALTRLTELCAKDAATYKKLRGVMRRINRARCEMDTVYLNDRPDCPTEESPYYGSHPWVKY